VNPLCIAANGAWVLSSLREALAFRRGLNRVAEQQERILLGIVQRNARTSFGRAHGFASIRTPREYQERVPVRTYDDFAEEMRRVEAGETNVLTASPVDHFEPTSGSSGASKLIPHTPELRAELERAIAPWISSLATSNPRAFAGRAYWSLSPVGVARRKTSGGIRVGFDGDEEYLGRFRGALARAVQAVPPSVRTIADIDAFRRATLDHLVACRSLSFISVWHPSFLSLLVEPIADTTAIWPHLRVISCWADAGCANAAAELGRRFPHTRIEPKGLLSTEGFVSIPFDGANVLAYRSHFVELRSVETGHVVPAAEASIGRYDILLTTGGGLYRYATDDLVDVTGFAGRCPILRFAGRARHVSDHFGEKLHEVFVRERIDRALGEHGIIARFATLAFDVDRYVLRIDSDASDDAISRSTARLEELLREGFHYDYCRRLGQLRAVGVRRTKEDLVAIANGRRLGDVKPSALSSA
jgi:GH3 auxin-responsive promoter